MIPGRTSNLVFLAIGSQPPRPDQRARRRAGLGRYPHAWTVVSEYNYDVAEHSWYLEPHAHPLGSPSGPFLKEVARALRGALASAAAPIDRTA
jgi:hypothetical protein